MTILNPTSFPLTVEGDTAVITPSGDLTAASADTLRRLLLSETDNGRRRFRFDLGQVRDLDSVSLSVLVAFAQLLRASGAPYVIGLVNCSADLLSLFRLTRLDQDFMFTLVARA
jgi:anti-anti-sigma factor